MIGVGGCVASQEGAAIVRRAPYVDVVFGRKRCIDCRSCSLRAAQRPAASRYQLPRNREVRSPPPPRVEGASAFVSIMEGCSKYCTFCVVPYTRGEEVSRPFDDVLTEIADLTDQGVSEITLLGQNVNAYRGALSGTEATADFALLIETIAEFDGIRRIRYTTSHPKEMSARLVAVYGRQDKLVSHLHLPVQSGSDRVLAAMKRGYTVVEYKSIVRRLRAQRPDLSLTTDFIVGFPGETEADFVQTMRLAEDVNFDGAFSFAYSARPGTPAAAFADAVPAGEQQARLARLQGTARCPIPRLQPCDGGYLPASAGDRAGRQEPARARLAHRQQSRRQFRRRRGADRQLRRRHDQRGASPFAARRAGRGRESRCRLPLTRLAYRRAYLLQEVVP
jgi:tRNA-2-methylthio-N6-dimethylallyladenosine synthase